MLSQRCLIYVLGISLVFSTSQVSSRYNVDREKITVSGFSSGGYFAVQMHVAYSGFFKGVGIIAGGPYYCSKGRLATAIGPCMAQPAAIDVDELVGTATDWAAADRIDPVANLADQPVYLLRGQKDWVVAEGVMDSLEKFYQSFGANITYNKDIAAGHSFITEDFGLRCVDSRSPFISNCNFDAAGAILAKLYGPLKPKEELAGVYVKFHQTAFTVGSHSYGLAYWGWLYVPSSCLGGAKCGFHVAFHGCLQNYEMVEDAFVRHTGFIEWANTNELLLLFPQTGNGSIGGCWDTWGGQSESETFAQQISPQMSVIMSMINYFIDD